MDSETAKETTRRWLIGIWDEGNLSLMDELASPDYTYSVPGREDLQGDDFRQFLSSVRVAFPDLHNSIDEQVVEGDIVVTRGVSRGTHEGPLDELEGTGRSVTVPWVIFTRFENGKIVGDWELYDVAAMTEQLTGDAESE